VLTGNVGSGDRESSAPDADTARLLVAAARQLGETLDPERIYDTFHGLLETAVPHDGIVVSSFEPSTRAIRCEYAWTDGNRLDVTTFPVLTLNPEGGGMQSRVIRSGEPILFNDVAERVERGGTFYNVDAEGNLKKLPDSGPAPTRAAIMVPVKHEGAVVGVVQVMSDHRHYGEEHLDIVEGLVGLMAAAVRNARLYEAAQREIAARARAEAEQQRLAVSEALARAIAGEREQAARVLQAVGDGIAFVDDDGVVRLWNRAAELLTGRRAEEAIGSPLSELIAGWEQSEREIPIADDETRTRSATIPFETEHGEELWLSVVAVRTTDGVIYALHDLSEDRRLELAKSDFIATISHELRTPLAAVLGAAQTLLREDVDFDEEQTRRLLELIATQANRLARITDEILLATRLDRGDIRVARDEVDVNELVHETVTDFQGRLPDGLTLDVATPVAAVAWADRDKLRQVVANLVDNAIKYSPGGGEIRVSVDEGAESVLVRVADTGLGIPAVEHERIFEKFYRADPHLLLGANGTGLGLYISRELIERMGGRITVESEAGVGSAFEIALPSAAPGT
jgi:PAS domain S-box-containing protein